MCEHANALSFKASINPREHDDHRFGLPGLDDTTDKGIGTVWENILWEYPIGLDIQHQTLIIPKLNLPDFLLK